MKPLLILSVSFLIVSCSDDNSPEPRDISDYSKLEIGNYWIYEAKMMDTAGIGDTTINIDSVYIPKDTLIGNKKLFIMEGTRFTAEFRELVFDSARSTYFFPSRDIIFSVDPNVKFHQVIGDPGSPHAVADFQNTNQLERIEVPAGKFACENFRGTISVPQGIQDPFDIYYSAGTGLILERGPMIPNNFKIYRALIRRGKVIP